MSEQIDSLSKKDEAPLDEKNIIVQLDDDDVNQAQLQVDVEHLLASYDKECLIKEGAKQIKLLQSDLIVETDQLDMRKQFVC